MRPPTQQASGRRRSTPVPAGAGVLHARATTATLRAHLVNIPTRLARSARRLTLRLPDRWSWQHAFTGLFAAAHAPLG